MWSVDIRRDAIREAIASLHLIAPDAEDRMLALLRDHMDIHPRQTATEYRKSGDQISKEEKQALGLRSNAFMSRQALDDLTEDGRDEPLMAHEVTLLRATFTANRYRTVENVRGSELVKTPGFEGMKIDVMEMSCLICAPLDGKVVPLDQAPIFPLEGCTCTTANFGLAPRIDWLAGVK